MRTPLLAVVAALAASTPAVAGESEAPATPPAAEGEGSLLKLVDDVASALEQRARVEHVTGSVKLEVTPSRGIDAAKVEKGFLLRLKRRLRDGGSLSPVADAPLRCRITLSEDGGLLWATAVFEGQALPGPSAVAVSRPIDRELEASLGAVVKSSQTRFSLERLGVVPAGVLDAALVDVDNDGADELAVLGVDGIRFFRAGGAHLEKMGGLVKLPGDHRWPRVAAGWLARLDGGRLWAVTDAGHSLVYDPKTQHSAPGPTEIAPFRGLMSSAGPLCGSFHAGSPVLTLPLVTLGREIVRTPGLPANVRDVAAFPGGTFIVVDAEGQLLGERAGQAPVLLTPEHVGDRLTVADLDGDGDLEVVTTSAAPPGEPDHLVVRHVAADLSSSAELYRTPLSGGSIAATAVGRVDLASRLDVIIIEEVGREALAWRLRYAP